MKVLFVDEKNTWHKFFDLVLSLRGVEVLHADTVKEALNMVSSEKPDAAIVDASISNASGYDLLPKLTELGVPVVFIGYEKEGFNKEKALSLGALETLKRPFTVEELIDALKRIKKEELQPQELQIVLPEETTKEEIPTISLTEEPEAEESSIPVVSVEEETPTEPTATEISVSPTEEKAEEKLEEIPEETKTEAAASETQAVTTKETKDLISKEDVEKIIREIVWEVVPEMAEKVIREEVEKLIRSRLA